MISAGVPNAYRSLSSHTLPLRSWTPPPPAEVPALVRRYAAATEAALAAVCPSAAELAAFCLCWVSAAHPFEDGNGRAARGLAAVVFAAASGDASPGPFAARLHSAFSGQAREYLCKTLEDTCLAAFGSTGCLAGPFFGRELWTPMQHALKRANVLQ